MAFFLKRIRRWWHLRNPEIRWIVIVEVGVDEVPEEAEPIPETMPGYRYISRSIDENSLLLDDPGVLLTVFRAAEGSRREKLRLHGLSGELKLLVSGRSLLEAPIYYRSRAAGLMPGY